MPSVAFEAFLPEVLPEAHLAPQPLAISAIRNACYDFCRSSLVWTEVQDPTNYSKGVADYDLDAPSGAQVISLLSLIVDGTRAVYPTTIEAVVATKPGWTTDTGPVTAYLQKTPSSVTLISVPDTDGVFVPTVAYTPTRKSTSIDSTIYELYFEAIKYGALWKLKATTNTPWADPTGAVYYERLFKAKTLEANNERVRGNARTSVSVAPRPFI